MSEMVMAKKYELQAKVVINNESVFDVNGQKVLKHGNRIMPRQWVEDRNSQKNNELYVIDEEATKEIPKMREKAIAENNAKAKKEKMTMADLVDAVVETKRTSRKSTTKEEKNEN